MKVDQPRGGEGRGGAVDPRETESMAWPLLVYARILSSFCSISAPFERSSFFFFFFFSFPKNREIPFNSLLENEPSPLPLPSPPGYWVLLRQEWRTRARHLLNFFWLKGHSIFRFFLEIFFLFFSCFIRARSIWRSFGEVLEKLVVF